MALLMGRITQYISVCGGVSAHPRTSVPRTLPCHMVFHFECLPVWTIVSKDIHHRIGEMSV
jgi:hypothetical protein